MSLPTWPWPEKASWTSCFRSAISRNARRTRTSLNGAWSTAMQMGTQPPPWLSRILKPLDFADAIWANGIALIASTWPPRSEFARDVVVDVDDDDAVEERLAVPPVVRIPAELGPVAG